MNTERAAEVYQRIKHLLWVRLEPLGSQPDVTLCRLLGGHVRFRRSSWHNPISIARWSATPHKHYRPMTFEEFIAMQEHGQFKLRKAKP